MSHNEPRTDVQVPATICSLDGAPIAKETTCEGYLYGEIAWLFAHSNLHKTMPLWKLDQWVEPPLMRQQFRLYRRSARPAGFLSYAYLSPAIASKYIADPQSLQPHEWQSGQELWLIDMIAPTGDFAAIAKDVRTNLFPNEIARSIRYYQGGKPRHVYRYIGRNAIQTAHQRYGSVATAARTDQNF